MLKQDIIIAIGLAFLVFVLLDYIMGLVVRHIKNRSKEKQLEADLDLIESNGIKSHLYFPGIGIENEQLYIALMRLNGKGYLFTLENGSLLGKVSTTRPSSDQIADERRAQFKIVPIQE